MSFDQGRDGVLERLNAIAGDRGDGKELHLAALGEGGQLLELVGVGDIGFGGYEDGRLGCTGSGRSGSAETSTR
jgi:hypothetical protein